MQKFNFTMVPNEVIDEHLKDLSGAEIKILLAISRKTIGWHKETDWICNAMMMKMTGLSKMSVIKGGKSLVEKGLITQDLIGEPGKLKIYYELNFEEVQKVDEGGIKSIPEGSNNYTHKRNATKETIQKKEQYAPSVKITEKQHAILIYDYGHSITAEAIEKLSTYKESTGKKYKSDYHTILNWVIKEVTGKDRQTIKAARQAERVKRKKQQETIRLIDEGKLEKRLMPEETQKMINKIGIFSYEGDDKRNSK